MNSELKGQEQKCREGRKHRTSGNIMHFGHDPVNFQSDHAKQAKIGLCLAAVYSIIQDHLKIRKLCSQRVPHDLTQQQKQARIDSSKQLLALNDIDPAELFAYLVTIRGSAMPYLRRNSSPCNGDMTVLQKRPDQC